MNPCSDSTSDLPLDPHHNHVSDHAETLALAHLANTVRSIAMKADGMVMRVATPARVDSGTRH